MIERRRMTRTVEAPSTPTDQGARRRLPVGLVVTVHRGPACGDVSGNDTEHTVSILVPELGWAWSWRDDIDPTHPTVVFGARVLDASEPCGKEGSP